MTLPKSTLAGFLAALSLTGVVLADTPPTWRGDPGSTLQRWDFTGNSTTPSPEVLANPYGTPTLSVDFNPPYGEGWYNTSPAPNMGTHQGIWDIANGSMSLQIPSVPVPAFYLQIQMQVIYWKDLSHAPTFTLSPSAVQIGSTFTSVFDDPTGSGAWYSDLIVWEVTPGPGDQYITLMGDVTFGSVIDQIIVDTKAVPEPAVLGFAALFSASLLLRRFLGRKQP